MDYPFVIKEPLSLRLYSPVQQTGFKYREMEEGSIFITGSKEYNHILFLLDGIISVSCNEFSKKIIHRDEFVLIPISADVSCKTVSYSCMLVFSFDTLPETYENVYLQSLHDICSVNKYIFTPLSLNESLKNFISLMLLYFERGLNKPILHEIKRKEFFTALQSFYSPKEVAMFLYPLIGKSTDFRTNVLRNYRKVESMKDFAKMLQMESKTFSRQFKEEFGTSPYQWLLNQKAKHVRFSLAESDKSLDDIRREHGFKFPGHFTRFCKEQFDTTPLQLRKRLKKQGVNI